MREGLLPDRRLAKGMAKINLIPNTQEHRRGFQPKPMKKHKPFAPTVPKVTEIVPQQILPKLR